MKQCPRCLNDDPSLFGIRNNEVYCRRCVGLLGKMAELESYDNSIKDPNFEMGFKLTKYQRVISDDLVKYGLSEDILVEAVCGAGKTELVLELIKKALNKNLRVGWVVARRQVVLQLGERLREMFSELNVVSVVGGQSEVLVGDLIIMTAHQLYRYPRTFDLMIIDEPDAFPFKGNRLLEGLLEGASIGTKIYLSATPDQELVSLVDRHLLLEVRPHHRPLVIPRVYKTLKVFGYFYLLKYLRLMKKVLVFVPTIKQAKWLSMVLKVPVLTSKSKDKEKIISVFDKSEGILVCTTILERGMTFLGCSVIVFDASHRVFDDAALVQISGRVDRSFQELGGECIFICHSLSPAIDSCLKRLKRHNQNVFGV